jgi:cell division transport system permease protein
VRFFSSDKDKKNEKISLFRENFFFLRKIWITLPDFELIMAKKAIYKFFNSKLTSAISVSMVLFLLGCTLAFSNVAREMSASILEKVALTIYLNDPTTPESIESMSNFLKKQPYAKDVTFISKEQAINDLCDEIGEDPEEFSEDNPLPNSFVVHVNAMYANNDSILFVAKQIGQLSSVDRVDYQKNMIHTIVRNVNRIAFAFLCATLLLLFISYVLIHNTIELLVHSDRFMIHTMKLVGATGNFIRRPYLIQSVYIALIAFLLSVAYIVTLSKIFHEDFPFNILQLHEAKVYLPLFGTLLVCSLLITSVATFFAVNKYLRKKSDDLYYI